MTPSLYLRPLALCRRQLLAALLLATAAPLFGQEAELSMSTGPTLVPLGAEAEIDVPAGYLFADGETTRQLMRSMGNVVSDREVGLLAPEGDANWFLVFEFFPEGYVEDTDQEEIDADALFDSMYEGTEAANEFRRENGFPALHLRRWIEEPHYDPASHNLVWATLAEDDAGQVITNYNMRVLGRRGYMSITLVADPDELTALKPEMASLMGGFDYQSGSRYADFTQGDKLAGYGLTALIAGGAGAAAAKLGLFAALGKFLAKAWKLLVVGLLALASGLKRFFGGKGSTPTEEEPVVPGAS